MGEKEGEESRVEVERKFLLGEIRRKLKWK